MKREYKLGESHVFPFERRDEFGYSFYPTEAYKEFKIFGLIAEAYEKTDTTQIDEMLIEISEGLQDYDVEDINDLVIGKFKIIVRPGNYFQSATYNPVDKFFYFFLNRKCLQDIKDYENIYNIKRHLKHLFVHEDTHQQQDIASSGKMYDPKTYIKPDKDLKGYLNQRTEIDALARQYGYWLRDLYPNESTDKLLKRAHTGDVKDDVLKSNLEQVFRYMSLPNQRFFLRNMYDYLEIEDKD